MTKLRFIKPWGPYQPGDLHEPKNANTIHMLVDVYKFAVVEPEEPAKPGIVPEPDPEPERDLYKYIRKPQQHKMVTGPPRAKRNQETNNGQ
jgi:hypothetical protein